MQTAAVAPFVASRLVHSKTCPANYRSAVPNAASLKAYGVAALVPVGANRTVRQTMEDSTVIEQAVVTHAKWIVAKCAVTMVSAGPISTKGSTSGTALPTGRASSSSSNGNKTLFNWSGWEFDGPGTGQGPYAYAGMDWTVPTAEFGVLSTTRADSVWPGIGTGDSKSDILAQGGTQTTAGPALVQSTYAWTELYPVQPTEVQIANLSINAGDPVGATVFVNAGGGAVIFDVCNGRGTCLRQNVTVPSGGVVKGQNAEFIAERPGIPGGDFSELNNFGTLDVTYASAAAHRDGQFFNSLEQQWLARVLLTRLCIDYCSWP
jgi:hypothetical protein